MGEARDRVKGHVFFKEIITCSSSSRSIVLVVIVIIGLQVNVVDEGIKLVELLLLLTVDEITVLEEKLILVIIIIYILLYSYISGCIFFRKFPFFTK